MNPMNQGEFILADGTRGMLLRPGILALRGGTVRLMGSRCRKCRKIAFPPLDFCNRCPSSFADIIPLSSEGELVSYTIVRQALPGFQAPYAIGLLKLPEGVRMYGPIEAGDPGALRIGMKLRLVPRVIRKDRSGRYILAQSFETVPGEST